MACANRGSIRGLTASTTFPLRKSAAVNRGALCTRAMASAGVAFKKYQGLGNDFIIVDNRDSEEPSLTPEQVACSPPDSSCYLYIFCMQPCSLEASYPAVIITQLPRLQLPPNCQ